MPTRSCTVPTPKTAFRLARQPDVPRAQRNSYSRVGVWATIVRALTVAVLVCSGASTARARNIDDVVNPRESHAGWVTDEPGVLGDGAGYIEERLEALHQQIGAEVAWVILRTIGDRDPRQFGTELLHRWGVGRKEQDDGVLVLHVLDRRRIEIVTGYGAEAALPDIKCSWLLQEVAVPAFRADQLVRGHEALSRGIDRALRSPDISHADLIAAAQYTDGRLATKSLPAPKRLVSPRNEGESKHGLTAMLLSVLVVSALIWRARIYVRLRPNMGCALVFPYGFLLFFALLAAVIGAYGGRVGIGIYAASLAVVISFGLRDLHKLRARMAPRPCSRCPRQLKWVEGEDALALMSVGARKEHELGSMRFEVRRCECGEVTVDGFEIESKIRRCPGCGHRTLAHVQTLTLKAATTAEPGQDAHVYECKLCLHELRENVVVPVVVRNRSSSSSSSGSSSSWSSDSGSSSSSSSSSDSFGGGDSGGGGAGASY